jgi:hypothetical protein
VPHREKFRFRGFTIRQKIFCEKKYDTITATIVSWKGETKYKKVKEEVSNEETENVSSSCLVSERGKADL